MKILLISAVIHITLVFAQAAQSQDHHADVNKHGDHVMGFSHEKTIHHFRLYPNGGAIEVEAIDGKDTASQQQIRSHLTHITSMFAAGNFQAPLLVHSQTPPGVPALQKLKDKVAYVFVETKQGGSVQIKTSNKKALEAVYQFLRFQITDHQTGDALTVSEVSATP